MNHCAYLSYVIKAAIYCEPFNDFMMAENFLSYE